MSTIGAAILKFRQRAGASDGPFRLVSTVSERPQPNEVDDAWGQQTLPVDARGLWETCRSARLFADADYGQWGLVLLDPQSSAQRTSLERARRPADLRSDDVVIGEFLGDQELLVIAPSEAGGRRILVALPLDPRDDWYGAGADLAQFLDAYFEAGGDKYWEPRRTNE